MADKIDDLFEDLQSRGFAKDKTREDFRSYMLAPGEQGYYNRKDFFEDFKSQGLTDLQSYEDFAQLIGLKGVPRKQQPSTQPASNSNFGFEPLDTRQADQASIGRGPVPFNQQQPEQNPVSRLLYGEQTPEEQKQVQKRLGQRMDELEYEQETGNRLRQPVKDVQFEAPTIARDTYGNIRRDENGNPLIGFSTDEDINNIHQQIQADQAEWDALSESEKRERANEAKLRAEMIDYKEPTLWDTVKRSLGSGIIRKGAEFLDLMQQLTSGMIVEDPSKPSGYMRTRSYDEALKDKNDPITRATDYLHETSERLSRQAQPHYGKGFLDMLWDGEIGNFLQKGVGTAFESLPNTMSIVNPLAMVANGMMMAGGNYRDQVLENPDIPKWKRASMAIGMAAIEQLTEKYSDPFFKYVRGSRLFKSLGKEASEEAMKNITKEATENIAKRIYQRLAHIGKDAVGEGAEEIISNFGSDALGEMLDLADGQKNYGIRAQWAELKKKNPDADLWEFAMDKAKEYSEAGIGGFMAGAYMSGSSQLSIKGLEYALGGKANAEQIAANPNTRIDPATMDVAQSYDDGYTAETPDDLKQFSDEAQAAEQNLPQYGEKFAKMVTESQSPVETLDYLMQNREYYTDEQIAAAADYYQKRSRIEGAMDGTLDRIDMQVEQANAEVRGNMHQNSGQVITAQIGDGAYYVIGGDVATDEATGMPVVTGTGGAVVVKDALTGEVSVKSPQQINVTSMTPADDMIRYNDEVLRQQLMQQADEDFTFGSPANEVYQLEDTVTLNDGEGNMIEGQIGMMPNAVDGVYVVYTPDGKALQYTADQLNRMIVAHNGQEVQRAGSQNVPQTGQMGTDAEEYVPETTENIPNQPQPAQSGETAGGKASAENGTGADNAPATALSRIPVLTDESGQPVLKKGRPQYQWHKASTEDAAAALIETTGGDMVMARDTASDLVKNAQAGLEKIRKQKPKGDDPIEIAESRMEIKRQEQEQQAIIKQWQDVNQAIQKQMRDEAAARQAEIEAAKSEEQRQREAAEAAERKKQQEEIDRQRIREQIEKDKERRNKEYQPLVDAREEMADDPDATAILSDTEPRSLDEWVSSLLRPHSMLWQDASPSEIGLQSELGLKRADMQRMMSLLGTKENGAKPFGQVVLDIHEGLTDAMKSQVSDEDVRQTLLDLFSEGSSTRMMHLTEEHRIEEAREAYQENLRRAAEYELEQWAEAYHLTPEERETYEDFLSEDYFTKNAALNNEQEIIDKIIADEEQNRRGQEVDLDNTSGTAGRESEGGESQVQRQGATEETGTDQTQQQDQGSETLVGSQTVSDTDVPGRTPEPGIAPSEQLKPIDLRDATRVESPEIGVAEANAKAREVAGIQPIGNGDFGPIYDQFRGKPKEAAEFLIEKGNGDVLGVFYRDEIGDVDLVWGSHKDHNGLEHLIIDHIIDASDFDSVDQMMEIIDDVITNGAPEKNRKSDDKSRYEKDGYIVSIRKQYRDEKGQVQYKKNWVVTAFESTRKEHEKKRTTEEADAKWKEIFGDKKRTSPRGTLTAPPSNRKAGGVTLPPSDVSSDGKDTNNFANLQEKTEKTSQEPQNSVKRLVSDERMEELKKQLRNKVGGQLNVGVDPEILSLGAQLAVGYLERGITKFADFAKAMIEEVGDYMRPYLKAFYNAVRDMPEAEGYAGQMDDYETVRKFDVHNFDKEGKVTDAITKAEQVVNEQKITKQARKIKEQHPNLFAGDLFATQDESQPIGKTSSAAKIAAEEDKVDTNPTEAQKEAGNYQKGHIQIDGYDITIENPKGSIRRGVDANDKAWEQVMNNTYGYIRGTESVDGDHIDIFLSDNPTSGNVYVVDQVKPDGSFDEVKVMYGFKDAAEATQAYLSNYKEGWKGLGAISGVSREMFKEWVNSSHRKTKPFREYAMVKAAEAKEKAQHLQLVKDRLAEHLKKYRTLAPVEIIDIDTNEEYQSLKDSKDPVAFDPETKKILIFANNIDENYFEEGLFHESVHRGLQQYYGDGPIELAEEFWKTESPDKPDVSKRQKEAISKEYAHKPEDVKEEYFVHLLSHHMKKGSVDRILSRLSPEHQEIVNNILHNIGYDTAEETKRRTGEETKTSGSPENPEKSGDGRRVTSSSTDKIEDVGEEIAGARKDLSRKIAQGLDSATKQTLAELPFSKAYKKPDLKKAVEEGALRESDAVFYDAFFSTFVDQNKPRVTKSDERRKKYNPGYKTDMEKWVDRTHQSLQTLKDFVEADEQQRDKIIEALLADKYPFREQELSDIEKRKEWNKDRKDLQWGDKTTPNPLWITYEVMKRLDYTPGDKLDIPFGILKADSTGTQYSLYNKKNDRNYYTSPKTVEEGIDAIVWLARLKRGDSDIQFPVSSFYTSPTKSETGENGMFRVVWGSFRNPQTRDFDSKEKAEEFAKTKKAATHIMPLRDVVRRFGYKVMFRNPLTGERYAVNDKEFDTDAEAMQYLDENYDEINSNLNNVLSAKQTEKENAGKKELTADDMVYTAMIRNKDGKYTYGVLIDKKYANNYGMPLVIKDGFATRNEAKEFAEQAKEEVFKAYKEYKEKQKAFVYFDTGADSRIGEDYRSGKDVTAEDFMNTFGFRGVQFGNWTNQADRQMAVNQAYDAFLDLAKLIGVSPKAISLNGELGIAFGARGSGNFAAHYEPGEIVINLTKTMGAGSLAHEWWHALDNYFARTAGESGGMVTDDRSLNMRQQLRDAFNAMLEQVAKSPYYSRSKDKGDYWGRMHEVTARLLAEWVDQELKKRGELNTFLSRGAKTEGTMKINYERYKKHAELAEKEVMPFEEYKKLDEAMAGSPYPSPQEVERFSDAMRNVFDVMQERIDKETGNVALFQKVSGTETAAPDSRESALRDALIDMMRDAGILIGTDTEVGQNVLDDVEGNAKTSKEKYFRTKDGRAYGYTYNGKIYIDPSIATSETPIHEYTHLWAEAVRENEPEKWNDIVDVLKNDEAVKPFWDKVAKQYPELTDDNDIAEEVLAQYSGKRGSEQLREVADEIQRETPGIFGKAQAVEALRRMKNVLTKFWRTVADVMGWKFTKAEEIADSVLSDLLNGKNPNEQVKERDAPIFVSNAMRAVEAIKQDKATPEQWLKMIEKGGGLKAGEDKWLGLSDWLNEQKDKKSLTKQEVMDYIRQNQIQIEEDAYEEFSFRHNKELKEFNDEFRDLMAEGEEETGSIYTADHADWAFDQMKDKYGDDFENAFDIQKNGDRWELVPTLNWNDELSEEARYYLSAENTINPTRMEYTTQGLDNKREIALTVPTIEPYKEGDQIHFGDAGGGRAVAWIRFGETTAPKKEKIIKVVKDFEEPYKNFNGMLVYYPKGEKFVGKDYIVYGKSKDGRMVYVPIMNQEQIAAFDTFDKARNAMNEWYKSHNVGETQYEKVLVIDEIQSKRHQDAREKGYKGDVKAEDLEKAREESREYSNYLYDKYIKGKHPGEDFLEYVTDEEKARFRELTEKVSSLVLQEKHGVPDAPFEKNWHELAMKRMLRYAAENGYDKIAWTKGEQQAERYDIGNVVEKIISYDYPSIEDPDGRNSKKIEVRLKDGNTMTMRIDQNGKVIEGRSDTEGKHLSDVVGKDLAKRIINGDGKDGTIFDANRDLPAKVIDGEGLRIGSDGMQGFYDQILPRFMDKYGKKWGVKTGEIELPDLEKSAQKMWSVDVTPEMRESVMQGQPMFQRASSVDDVAQKAYNEEVAKKSINRIEAWQDSMIGLKAIQDAIAKETGNVATGAENAYLFENRMHGRAKNMTETYDWRYYRPMLKAFNDFCKQRGLTQEQGMDYLIAKSGLERNLYYAFRDASKAKMIDEINEERDDLEKTYARGRISEDDYKAKKQELEEREQNGVDDFIKDVRESYAYQHARDEYQNGNISYTEYLRILETVIRSQVMRKTPKQDSNGNIVSDNYYDDYAKDYSGLTETFAKKMYDEAQEVKKQAQKAIDPQEKRALWAEYDEKMRNAYTTARQVAEDAVFSAESDREPTDKLWKAVNAATKQTLKTSYESGLMDRNTYNKVREMFDYYIPLRGWEEDKASDVYNYMGKENVFSPAVKKTWGRTSQAENPLAYIGNIAVSTILSGHRNQMKQHFLNYVMNNPTSLVSISESWYENIAPEGEAPVWVLRSADTAGKSADEIAQIVNDFNDEMLQKQAEGRAIPVTGRLRLDVNATSGQKAEHVVEVQRAGHTYQLYINGDPKAAQALNGTNSKVIRFNKIEKAGEAISRLNHSMAAFFTSKNPAFVVSNLSRDMNMAGASIAIKESKEYNERFIKNVAKVLAPRMGESSSWVPAKKQPTGMMPSLMRKYKNGTLDTSNETERLFKEFMEEGGETGFVNMLSVDSFKEKMRKEISQMNGSSILGDKGAKETTVGKGLRMLGDTFEFYNRCAEDTTRFIVYMTSRQMGKSLEDSIADAKDVTLNFNRKGTGKGVSGLIQDLFIFVNPAIQALANMYKMAKGHALRFGAVTAGFIAGGALMPIINQWLINMFGDDDDKEAYWNLPPWVRKNNLVLWIPGTKFFLTIPLAPEFRVFYGVGEMISCSVMDHSVGNMGLELVSSVADLVPINPTGNGGNLMVDLSPTGIQPLIQIGENIDFTGRPLWKENQGNKFAPMYTKAYVSTPTWMVKLSEKVNDATGGNEGKKGWVEQNVYWGDYLNNPAVWNHLLQGYFGGMYNTISKGFDVAVTAGKGEVPKIYQTPVVNRFLNRPVERDNAGVLGEEYYNLINERDRLQYELRTWKKKAADGEEGAQKHVDEILSSDDYKRSQVISHYEKIMKDLKPGEKAATNDVDKDLIKQSISNYKQQMTEELAAIDDGKDPLEAAVEKFDDAKTFSEKNQIRMRIERLTDRNSTKKPKASEDEVKKALSYSKEEESEERKSNEKYIELATGQNIRDDARIRTAKKKIAEHTKEFKRLIDSRAGEKAGEYRQKHLKYFQADDIIKSQERAMKNNQKLLGQGHDAAIMKQIDANRNRMLKAIEGL